jgi:hypothetical protein
VLEELVLPPGEHVVSVFVPAGASEGETVFRFRFSREPGLWFNGFAMDGEVEDYIVAVGSGTGVEEKTGGVPSRYRLRANYPNPFNPCTHITFELPQASKIYLEVYDVHGTRVRTLAEASYEAGMHSVEWDGRDGQGRSAASGIYLCRLRTSGFQQTIRMVLLK